MHQQIQQQQPQHQRRTRRQQLAQRVPWQVGVGLAFAATVLYCARRRLNRNKRQRRARGRTSASPGHQVAAEQFATERPERPANNGSVAQCRLPPLKVLLVNEALNCTVQQLWHIICKPDAHFQRTIHRLSGNREIVYGEWHKEGGELVREETYINPLKKNSLGPSEADCVDKQRCVHRSAAGFVVERKVYTLKVPFGGSFHNVVQWCAWVEPGSNKVRLQVSCDVTFTKRFVPVKGIIYSCSIEGMQRFYKMWLEQLYHHLKLMNSPSQSTATVPQQQGRRQGQMQSALKQKAEPMRLSLDVLLPWLALLVMVAWLVMQSLRQNQGFSRLQSSAFGVWSNSNSVLPNLVPVPYPAAPVDTVALDL